MRQSKCMKLYRCSDCKKIYVEISFEEAERQVNSFNEFYETLNKKQKSHYSGPLSISDYKKCSCGNSYENFKEANSVHSGAVTVSGILTVEGENKRLFEMQKQKLKNKVKDI